MRPEQSIVGGDSEDSDASHVQRQIASLEFDERLLPLFEERQLHIMNMERQRQKDDAETTQLLIKEGASITKLGQFFSWTLALGGLIGGIHLINIGEVAIGVALLFGDASFVAINTLRADGKKDS